MRSAAQRTSPATSSTAAPLLSIRGAARELSCSRVHIYTLALHGEFKVHRGPNRVLMIRRADLERYRARIAGAAASTPEAA